jgi:nucleoporin POM34
MERRLSYTGDRKSSPMSFGETDSSGSLFSTPTKEKRASVGLNNKWLYERGRGSPRAGLRSSIPGGSVFN